MFQSCMLTALSLLTLGYSAAAHPGHSHAYHVSRFVPRQDANAPFSAAKFPDVQQILEGNQRFQESRDAGAIQRLVDDGQTPPFMMVSCSDSRAPESTIFDADPGTFFMSRNIANQYKPGDESAQSVLAYGITVLGVDHVVVLGHYGCGGIAASIASAPKENIDVSTHVVQTWISDTRSLYLSSNRSEIVEMRERNLAIEAEGGVVGEPESVQDPGFRALVEENVKLQVKRISESSIISNLHERLAAEGVAATRKRAEGGAVLKPVFVHGFVHDLETGEVIDLGVSTGPAGFEDFVPSEGAEEVVAEPESQPEQDAPADSEPVSEVDAPAETEPVVEEEPVPESEGTPATGGRVVILPPLNRVSERDVKVIGARDIPAGSVSRRQLLGRPVWSTRA